MQRSIITFGLILAVLSLTAFTTQTMHKTQNQKFPDISSFFVPVPGTETNRHSFQVPVLMFHYIRPLPPRTDRVGIGLSVTPEHFSRDLDVLMQKGYHTISFAQLADTGAILPSHPIILTFDDGYSDAYNQAFPALLAHHMTGTFYVISGFVGKRGYATWDQLKKMSGSGMEIGAHSVHHYNLSTLSIPEQKEEIEGSVWTIGVVLHIPIKTFAYPSGKYDRDTLKITKEAGIVYAVTTHTGIANNHSNLLELPRLRISDKTDFKKLL